MEQLQPYAYRQIERWIHRNARRVELALWAYHFEQGGQGAVLDALEPYQNEDGGFGHALEPDSWNPHSSPYTTMYALDILRDIGCTDANHPMIEGIQRYLESPASHWEHGWYFNIPTNDQYAHAPWWHYNLEANVTEGIGVTAKLAGFILRYVPTDRPLYRMAMSFAQGLMEKLDALTGFGDMGIDGYCVLLEDIEKAGLAGRFDVAHLRERTQAMVCDAIERDVTRWTQYTPMPSRYIHSPGSRFYSGQEAILEAELNYLIDTLPEDGVWGIPWSWFDLGERYAREFAISENWWKAAKAIDKLCLLRSFGRLSEG